VALTFNPHPVALLRPDKAPVPLLWTERNAELLQQAGATEVGVFRTGPWLLGLTAREFFERVVLGSSPRGDGRGAELLLWTRPQGRHHTTWRVVSGGRLAVRVVARVPSTASSSRRRASVRPSPRGVWRRRRGCSAVPPHPRPRHPRRSAGAGLGFPTANLDGIDTLIPGDGVYAAQALLDGQGAPIPTACHVGPNVTFGEQMRKVEAHLIDFAGDLYGRTVHLDVLDQIRPSRKFAGWTTCWPRSATTWRGPGRSARTGDRSVFVRVAHETRQPSPGDRHSCLSLHLSRLLDGQTGMSVPG